jgi:hypothetical protein
MRYLLLCVLALASGAPSAFAQSLDPAVPGVPAVAFTGSWFSATPSSGRALIGVTLTEPPTAPVVAVFTTIEGTAVAGVDFTATTTTLTWANGDPQLKVCAVPIESTGPGDRSFSVDLYSATGATLGTTVLASVLIQAAPGSASGAATLSWSAPTENTNGTALTNLAGYNIYYGTSPSLMNGKISIETSGLQTYVITNLAVGVWYFEVTAVNALGLESTPAGPVSATI